MAGIIWWTEERKAELRKLLEEGLTHLQAADRLTGRFSRQVTQDAVAKQAKIIGVEGKKGRPKK